MVVVAGVLRVLKRNGEMGGSFPLADSSLTIIGRDPDKCDIQIKLPEVSREQATAKRRPESLTQHLHARARTHTHARARARARI